MLFYTNRNNPQRDKKKKQKITHPLIKGDMFDLIPVSVASVASVA